MTDNNNSSNSDKRPAPKLPSNFSVLTFSAACPSCGAPVEFASPGSVMAVCEYCQTTVLREGDALVAQGKQSLTIEDYSPLQIGSVGRFDGNDFALIGRVQLQYGQGVWNEWYIQFADGRSGWLSEALGLYSITIGSGTETNLPTYDQLAINDSVRFEGALYQVNDRRDAYAIAGEGELPFIVGKGWETWVIDAQYKRESITLDYADSGPDSPPIVHKGRAVELLELDMQLLKDDRQISEHASQADTGMGTTGADASYVHISKIECPNCGSPIPYVEGATDFLMCPSCHSEVKLTGSTAKVVQMHSTMQNFDSTLPLGAKARIASADVIEVSEFSLSSDDIDKRLNQTPYHDYVVIGVMRFNEVGEFATWTEYLLYSLTDGFLWLSEESGGWFISRVLSEMPVADNGRLLYDEREWRQVDAGYHSRVIFAMGAFNWQVKINDSDLLIDYVNGEELITSEQTAREITYTHAKPISYATLEAWFGSYLRPENSHVATGFEEQGSLGGLLKWHAILQVAAWLLAGGSIIVGIIGAILMYIIYFKASDSAKDNVGDDVDVGPFSYHSSGVKGMGIAVIVLSLIMSLIIGMANAPSATGPNSEEEATGRSGGGLIFIPTGGGGSGNSGRTGYSSGGSHK